MVRGPDKSNTAKRNMEKELQNYSFCLRFAAKARQAERRCSVDIFGGAGQGLKIGVRE